MLDRIKKIFQLLSLHDVKSEDEKKEDGTESHIFVLMYNNLPIGELRFDGNVWYFSYTKMFQNQSSIDTIPTFPNKSKEYKSEVLWPFFQARIPSLKQPKVQEIIRRKGIKENDLISLLKTFGLRSINNPFVLQ
ncbi:MAG: HipA N-terminal domain-containing protein [Saprospiraceae bacterium]|nr:HipA N-terminal domain-containing protein [Saprospiraceae bacterium]